MSTKYWPYPPLCYWLCNNHLFVCKLPFWSYTVIFIRYFVCFETFVIFWPPDVVFADRLDTQYKSMQVGWGFSENVRHKTRNLFTLEPLCVGKRRKVFPNHDCYDYHYIVNHQDLLSCKNHAIYLVEPSLQLKPHLTKFGQCQYQLYGFTNWSYLWYL